jgi:Tfp pilus assembly protein PilE
MVKVALELLVVVAVVAIGSLVVLPARAARAAFGLIRHNAAPARLITP